MGRPEKRLDVAEQAFFEGDLSVIDNKVYEQKYPELKAREFFPSVSGVDPDAHVYEYRMKDYQGEAAFIGNTGDDIPRAESASQEFFKKIHNLGMSFGYSWFEIRAAARAGSSLNADRAFACRKAIEQKSDSIDALGDAGRNIEGVLSLNDVSPVALGALWNTLTPEQIRAELMGLTNSLYASTRQLWEKFTVLIPVEQHNMLQEPLGTNADKSIMDYIMSKATHIDSIEAWDRCKGAGVADTDRMMIYPKDPDVVGLIHAREYTQLPGQVKNFEEVVNATKSLGGAVCRYPFAVKYYDGL